MGKKFFQPVFQRVYLFCLSLAGFHNEGKIVVILLTFTASLFVATVTAGWPIKVDF